MKKRCIWILAGAIVVVGGIVYFATRKRENKSSADGSGYGDALKKSRGWDTTDIKTGKKS